MEVRRRALPPGWYPASGAECRRQIEGFLEGAAPRPAGLARIRGAIVPHAGWFYSGRLAAWAFAAAAPDKPAVVILFGGHLSQDPPRLLLEDAWETPLGEVALARELAEELAQRLPSKREPPGADNTIEVHLPMLKFFFPQAKLLLARAPHLESAIRLGQEAACLCQKRSLSCVVLGSTDLTHYGLDYGFMPAGGGPEAVEWVRRINDARFIEAALALDSAALLRLGPEEGSACSGGAAAAAVSGARFLGAERGHLLGSYLSTDVMAHAESFVGYAAIVF